MLQRIAFLAIAAPRRIVAAAVLVTLAAGIFGLPVAGSLSSGGFQDPNSESARATHLLTDKFGQGDLQMLITVTAPDSATGPAATAVGLSIVDQLRRAPNVADVTSPWSAPPAEARDLVAEDGRAGLIVAGLSGGESVAQTTAQTLADQVARDHPDAASGVVVRSGGVATVNAQITSQLQHDLLLMESIAVPLSFLLLVWVFGGLLAAALPVAVGLMAIVGSMAVLRFITFSTDVSNLRAQPQHGVGPRAGDRLHVADHQPLSRRIGRRCRTEHCTDPHHDDGGPHGAGLGDDGCAVDGCNDPVPDARPEVVRLRRCRHCRVGRTGGGCRHACGHRAAGGQAERHRCSAKGAAPAAPA